MRYCIKTCVAASRENSTIKPTANQGQFVEYVFLHPIHFARRNDFPTHSQTVPFNQMAFRLPVLPKAPSTATRCSENGCFFGTYGVTSHLSECYTRNITCEAERIIQRRVALAARRKQRAAMTLRERALHRAEMQKIDPTWTPGQPEPFKPSKCQCLPFQHGSNPPFISQRRRRLELRLQRGLARLLPLLPTDQSVAKSFFRPVSQRSEKNLSSLYPYNLLPVSHSDASPVGLGSRLAHLRDVSRQRGLVSSPFSRGS